MKTLFLILGVVLCLVAVQARRTEKSLEEQPENVEQPESISSIRDFRAGQMRHRRKRWQMNYGYDYPAPPNPYFPSRRVYESDQDMMSKILRLLDEIQEYVRRPPPPPVPQPIYVPYPVPYPVPQNCTCNVNLSQDPNVKPEKRFPILEDSNQNWGIMDPKAEELEQDSPNDGARPISFDPILPEGPMKIPAPKVDHGSSQSASTIVTTQAPREEKTSATNFVAGGCNAAILTCCNDQNPRPCFTKLGCSMTYTRKNACSRESISAAIEAFRRAYSAI